MADESVKKSEVKEVTKVVAGKTQAVDKKITGKLVSDQGDSVQVKSSKLSADDIKNMSKYRAQQILRARDPEALERIEQEVEEKVQRIRRRIKIAGWVIVISFVIFLAYGR